MMMHEKGHVPDSSDVMDRQLLQAELLFQITFAVLQPKLDQFLETYSKVCGVVKSSPPCCRNRIRRCRAERVAYSM